MPALTLYDTAKAIFRNYIFYFAHNINMKRCAVLCIIVAMTYIIFCGAAQNKTVYLTFDDGPSKKVTCSILDTLEKFDIKATFFVTGVNVLKNPDVLKKIHQKGHKIGLHTYSHVYKEIYKDPASLIADIEKCKKAVLKVLPDLDLNLYRFPGGSFFVGEEYKEAVKSKGYRFYDWNCTNGDCEISGPAENFAAYAEQTSMGKNKVIVLMHDTDAKAESAKSLPDIIKYFLDKGYKFGTLN